MKAGGNSSFVGRFDIFQGQTQQAILGCYDHTARAQSVVKVHSSLKGTLLLGSG